MRFLYTIFCLSFVALNANAKYANYAAVAIDTSNGEILYSQNPDKQVYIASITKLMTIYLAFEAILDNRISLYDKVQVSELAARQPEKKMHLLAGTKYTLKELLMATAIFSANDAAFAIAEELSGSIEDFVYLMNQKAAELGLINTKYLNPSGFPSSISTPREVVRLAQILREKFPQYYYIFSIEAFAMNGKIYGNSNRLLGFFKGMDGLKTGFTNISGYNLACSFKYQNHVIFAAVFGLATSQERDKHMREVLDYSIKKSLSRKMIKDDKTDQFILEYEKFLRSKEDEETQYNTSLYFQIIKNIITGYTSKRDIFDDNKRQSFVSDAISGINNLSEVVSQPLPIIRDN